MSSVSELAQLLYDNLNGSKKPDIIIDIILNNNLEGRNAIAQYYKATFEKSLFEEISSKMGRDFGNCAGQMFLSPLEFCLFHLKNGIRKQNEIVFEMLTSKTPEELKIIENAYRKNTGKELKTDLAKAFKGAVGNNLLNLFDTPRIVNPNPNKSECERYANKLIEKDPKNWTEDENLFKEVFIQRSPEELVLIARYYLKITKNNLIDIIEKKTKGNNQILLREILYNNSNPQELFAEKIKSAIKGLGTNEEALTRVLVSRCELDMPEIRQMYQYKYKVTLKEDIIGDTSEAYQKLCVYLSEK